ncbi:MAG: outer membrane protein assembly factor BamD [Planctomycetota bacterium]|jgi:hypothetical protein
MFQLPDILPLTEYFVMMLANDSKYPDVYRGAQRLLNGKDIPSDWLIHFVKPDGTEMVDLQLYQRFEISEIRDKMRLAIKKVGKGITQSKFNKVKNNYLECAVYFEIRKFKDAKKEFEKFAKSAKIDCYLIEDAKAKVKEIESMAEEMLEEAKEAIENEDFDSGFEQLYEIQHWYAGLPEQKEIKEAIKELNKKYKDNKDARLAMKAAKESVTALKEYQKAQCYYMQGKDAQGMKSMQKIQAKFPDTKYATMAEELVDVKLPLVAPAGATGAQGG